MKCKECDGMGTVGSEVEMCSLCSGAGKIYDRGTKMKLALDFDNTFTRDPELWKEFIGLCNKRGHEIMIVTMRAGRGDAKAQVEAAIGDLCPVIYCHHTFKRKVTSQKGVNIDIWIDDLPEGIGDQRLMMAYDNDGTPQTLWEWLDRPVGKE